MRSINVQPEMKPVDFHLEKGNTLRVRVVDKDKNPLEGVRISLGRCAATRLVAFQYGGRDRRRGTLDLDLGAQGRGGIRYRHGRTT